MRRALVSAGYERALRPILFKARGGDPERPGKKDPLDCLLWRSARPGEPSWDGPVGPGRPVAPAAQARRRATRRRFASGRRRTGSR